MDHTTDHPRQTVEDTKAFLELYEQNCAAGEKLLKEQSLQPIKVFLHSSVRVS